MAIWSDQMGTITSKTDCIGNLKKIACSSLNLAVFAMLEVSEAVVQGQVVFKQKISIKICYTN